MGFTLTDLILFMFSKSSLLELPSFSTLMPLAVAFLDFLLALNKCLLSSEVSSSTEMSDSLLCWPSSSLSEYSVAIRPVVVDVTLLDSMRCLREVLRSLARLFWNQILIWRSDKLRTWESSDLRLMVMYLE